MPWEQERTVKILYHITGAITFVNETQNQIRHRYRKQIVTNNFFQVMQNLFEGASKGAQS